MTVWGLLSVYAAAVAVVVRTLTDEELFREPRQRLAAVARDGRRPLLLRKLAYMPTCEFCCSFWVTLALAVGVFDFRMAFDDWRGYLVAVFATMAVANVYLGGFSLIRVALRRGRADAEQVEQRRRSA